MSNENENRPGWSWSAVFWLLIGGLLLYGLVAGLIAYFTNVLPRHDWLNLRQDYPLIQNIIHFLYKLFSVFWILLPPLVMGVIFAYFYASDFFSRLYGFSGMPAQTKQNLFNLRAFDMFNGNSKVDLKRQKFSDDTAEFADEPLANLMLYAGGPMEVGVGQYDVSVTEANGQVQRVLGSNGSHKLQRFERVQSLLDLREQEREQDIELTTAEGFKVRTKVHVNFIILPDKKAQSPHSFKYSFKDQSVRRVANLVWIDEKGQRLEWDERPLMVVIEELRKHVSTLQLDQFLNPGEIRAKVAHPHVQQLVFNQARPRLRKEGIHLFHARLTSIRIHPDMHDTILNYWEAFGDKADALKQPSQDAVESDVLKKKGIREKIIQQISVAMHTWEPQRYEGAQVTPDMLLQGLRRTNYDVPSPEMQEFLGDEELIQDALTDSQLLKLDLDRELGSTVEFLDDGDLSNVPPPLLKEEDDERA